MLWQVQTERVLFIWCLHDHRRVLSFISLSIIIRYT